MSPATLLIIVLTAQATATEHVGVVSGTAVNGTQGQGPLANAEIVLRASQNGAFVPVAQTVTDALGRFTFDELPLGSEITYLAGVNRAGVHYPGPRVRLDTARPSANLKLTAYDAIESPSPLVSRRHEVSIQYGQGYLDITETLRIENPSLTAYVGTQQDDVAPSTLNLTLPPGFDKITFDKEFHGRNFQLKDGCLNTELPWPPGKRELKFSYRIPADQRRVAFSRRLDLPTEETIVHVHGNDIGPVVCNLPSSSSADNYTTFANTTQLPAGYEIELRLGSVPLGFEAYGRWLAVAVLASLVTASVLAVRSDPNVTIRTR